MNLAARRAAAAASVLVLALAVLLGAAPPAAASAVQQHNVAVDDDAAEVGRAVTAKGAVLWDPLDRRVLWGRDETVARPMASTTKIMTALLAIEAGTFDDTVTVSQTAATADDEAGAASLGLRAGQRIAMHDLLIGLMLRSGNDAAVAVAEHVAGSEAAFVDRMNARAAELGMQDTNFINASGLTNSPRHHASPLDLAVLAHEAMSDDRFAEIAGLRRATVPGLGEMDSRNLLLRRYDGATGVKTGYMASAGLCLVASATRDGRDLYAVVLDSRDSFGDVAALLDHGYEDFTVVALAGAPLPSTYRTSSGAVALRVPDTVRLTVPADAKVRVRTRLVPVPPEGTQANTALGEAELLVDGEVRGRAPLTAEGPLPEAPQAPAATSAGAAVQDALRTFVRVQPVRRSVP